MKFRLEIQMDNDAFAGDDQRSFELGRILADLGVKMQFQNDPTVGTDCPIFDLNGNRCGFYRFSKR